MGDIDKSHGRHKCQNEIQIINLQFKSMVKIKYVRDLGVTLVVNLQPNLKKQMSYLESQGCAALFDVSDIKSSC